MHIQTVISLVHIKIFRYFFVPIFLSCRRYICVSQPFTTDYGNIEPHWITKNKNHCKKVHLFTVIFCVLKAKNNSKSGLFFTYIVIILHKFTFLNCIRSTLGAFVLRCTFYIWKDQNMRLFFCIDSKNGMMFLGKRQSQDKTFRKWIINYAQNLKLWMSLYSSQQLESNPVILVDDD